MEIIRQFKGWIVTFSGILVFGILISVVVWTVKKIVSICVYCRGTSNPSLIEEHADIHPLLENDGNWIADRMEHPDNYDEQHVQYAPYDLPVSQPQDVTVCATYGSTIRTDNSETNQLSLERDTRSTASPRDKQYILHFEHILLRHKMKVIFKQTIYTHTLYNIRNICCILILFCDLFDFCTQPYFG